jgi:hypothetical protein
MVRAKADALNRAEANGIREETRRLGEGYFRSLFSGLGFKIEFLYTIDPQPKINETPKSRVQ